MKQTIKDWLSGVKSSYRVGITWNKHELTIGLYTTIDWRQIQMTIHTVCELVRLLTTELFFPPQSSVTCEGLFPAGMTHRLTSKLSWQSTDATGHRQPVMDAVRTDNPFPQTMIMSSIVFSSVPPTTPARLILSDNRDPPNSARQSYEINTAGNWRFVTKSHNGILFIKITSSINISILYTHRLSFLNSHASITNLRFLQ